MRLQRAAPEGERPDTSAARERSGVSLARQGRWIALLLALAVLAACPTGASARAPVISSPAPATAAAGLLRTEADGLHELLQVVTNRYASAQPTHEPTLATVARMLAQGAEERVGELAVRLRANDRRQAIQARGTLADLQKLLRATTQRFQPWPLTLEVNALAARAQSELAAITAPGAPASAPYGEIAATVAQASAAAKAGRASDAYFEALHAYALYAAGPGRRLALQDPALDDSITRDMLVGGADRPSLARLLADGGSTAQVSRAARVTREAISIAAETLGEVTVSHATIVVNGAIIVFREGLEAVLILAAITASFTGSRRHLRRPVLIGAVAGLGVTALTWAIAQVVLDQLGDGGLRLQAVTGLLAILVLALVTNWFFHRVYWSEWISRFNRRRKALERWDRLGFISGQALGFVLLGLSSVYREGLETVLFLQALQTGAGAGATALGAGIGLIGTLIVGLATFKLQRKLPFKRMLVVTGVLIALVLAVMVGTTVHNMQGIGWLASTPTSFTMSVDWSTWLGVYPTWQGIGAQLGALAFVFGSYAAAREIQVKRPSRLARARRTAAARNQAPKPSQSLEQSAVGN